MNEPNCVIPNQNTDSFHMAADTGFLPAARSQSQDIISNYINIFKNEPDSWPAEQSRVLAASWRKFQSSLNSDPRVDASLYGTTFLLDLVTQIATMEPGSKPVLLILADEALRKRKDLESLSYAMDEAVFVVSQEEQLLELHKLARDRLNFLKESWRKAIAAHCQIESSESDAFDSYTKNHDRIDHTLRLSIIALAEYSASNAIDIEAHKILIERFDEILHHYPEAHRLISELARPHPGPLPRASTFDGGRALSVIAIAHASRFLVSILNEPDNPVAQPAGANGLRLGAMAERAIMGLPKKPTQLRESLSRIVKSWDAFPGDHRVIEILEGLQTVGEPGCPRYQGSVGIRVMPDEAPSIPGLEQFKGFYDVLRSSLPLQELQYDFLKAKDTLNRESPWLQDVTQLIFARLQAHCALDPEIRGALLPPLLLIGPPGNGKTHFALRLMELLGLQHRMISMSGMSDSMTFRGAPLGYSTARPSAFVQAIRDLHSPNPVFILDEIDKAGTGRQNGNPHDVLLQCLEPRNAKMFFDEGLQSQMDISYCSYIATANSLHGLSEPLRNRFTVIRVNEPSKQELLEFAIALWSREMERWQFRSFGMPELPERLIEKNIDKGANLRDVSAYIKALTVADIAYKNTPGQLH